MIVEKKTVKLTELKLYPDNPNQGDIGAIATSIEEFGQFRSIVVNKRTMEILAGNHTFLAMKMLGKEEIDAEFVDVDEITAKKIVLADNRLSEISMYDTDVLKNILIEIAEIDTLVGTGFDGDDLDALIAELETPLDLDSNKKVDPDEKKNFKRKLPLHLIYSFSPYATTTFIAKEFGWLAGSISKECHRYVDKEIYRQRFDWSHKIEFIDNEWKGYDHERHIKAVSFFKPKYATTRDIMSSDQCRENDIEYYTFDQIMDFAKDVDKYAENTILIPKYDCIDKIPENYVLGFSVPTSYGGTEVNYEAFKGRKIHLLGGSWKLQLQYLEYFGDDVISIDNNYIYKIGEFGQYVLEDGSLARLDKDMNYPVGSVKSHVTLCTTLSIANITKKVTEMFGQGQLEEE